MFSVLLRATILLAVGGLITLIFGFAADPFVSILFDHASGGSRNAYWAEQAVTWLPGVVIVMVVIKIVAGATVRRGVR